MNVQDNINTLVSLYKDGMQTSTEAYDLLDDGMKAALKKWIDDHNFTDIPIADLGFDNCIVFWMDDDVKVFNFQLYYDGSDSGTDPCGGDILFSWDGKVASYLYDDVECED